MSTATVERTNGASAQREEYSLPATPQQSTLPSRGGDEQLGVLSALIDNQAWNRMVKFAEVFGKSTLVPKHFQGNTANCLIAIQCAIRMKVDPFMLMQNMYIVHGKPGLEAKFAIALANSKGVFHGPIRFKLSGEGFKRQCTAIATDRETGETLEETVTIEMAKKEGWIDKDGSKWRTIPDLMLKYRSAMWLIRTTCPEVLMGMQTTDELLDVGPSVIEAPARTTDARSASDKLADMLEQKPAVDVAGDAGDGVEQSIDELELVEQEPEAVPESESPEVVDPEPKRGRKKKGEEAVDSVSFGIGEQESAQDYIARMRKTAAEAQGESALDAILGFLQTNWDSFGEDGEQIWVQVEDAVERRRESIQGAKKSGRLMN